MNRQPLRGNDIREYNEKLVLNLIHKNKGISQSEIARITGLKAPTVLRIFSKLEDEGYIRQCGTDKDTIKKKGRKPVFYCVSPGIFNAVGIDFWSKSASIVMVDFCGNTIFEKIYDFKKNITADEIKLSLKEHIDEAIEKSEIEPGRLLGIGIGAPGRVDIKEGSIISYARIKGMNNFPLKKELEQFFDVPIFIHNNSSVIALSEYRYGIAKNIDSLLLILIRSGVGGALIDQGKIFTSQNRTALEIGHMSIDLNGKRCSCGKRGCLEAYISEDTISSELQKVNPLISLSRITDREVNDDFIKVIEKQSYYLFEGIKNLYQVFTPQSFLIITRSKIVSGLLENFIVERLKNDSLSGESNFIILSDEYDPILAGAGATDLVFDNFFADTSR
ncbi:MAG: ROK family transcriptional regulator [Spirochaetes bacterium]|nr:ROK family transcriptional regulator [Spirochaetota bacterium]